MEMFVEDFPAEMFMKDFPTEGGLKIFKSWIPSQSFRFWLTEASVNQILGTFVPRSGYFCTQKPRSGFSGMTLTKIVLRNDLTSSLAR